MSPSPTIRRLSYGERIDAVTASYSIASHSRARFKEIAHRSGMSASHFLEVIADQLPLDKDGIPLFLAELSDEEDSQANLKTG